MRRPAAWMAHRSRSSHLVWHYAPAPRPSRHARQPRSRSSHQVAAPRACARGSCASTWARGRARHCARLPFHAATRGPCAPGRSRLSRRAWTATFESSATRVELRNAPAPASPAPDRPHRIEVWHSRAPTCFIARYNVCCTSQRVAALLRALATWRWRSHWSITVPVIAGW